MLEQRVDALEKRSDRIEGKLDRIDETMKEIRVSLVEISANLRNCASKSEIADLQKDVAYVRGRLENVPSFWQMIALISAMLIGIAGIAFTAGKFLHS